MAVKVSLGFANLRDGDLDNFAQVVIDGMTGNTAFPTPHVSMANLQTLKDDFVDKCSAAQTGGVTETAVKNTARQALLAALRQQALYVELTSNGDLAKLLSSGFEAQSTNRASSPLPQPQNLWIKNGGTGQLIASVNPIKNATMYEGRAKLIEDGAAWLPSVFTGDSKHITFTGLTRGKDYTIQVRAIGGSTGQSDWSDPSSHMAM
jgi:hypothetical protein